MAAHRLLIVDDESDILESLQGVFGQALTDVETITATSGEEALELLAAGPFDLILTDYKMPGLNGLEFLLEAEKVAPGTPRIMMTAFPDPQLAAKAVTQGRVALMITKPFDLQYFVEVVRSIIHPGQEPAK